MSAVYNSRVVCAMTCLLLLALMGRSTTALAPHTATPERSVANPKPGQPLVLEAACTPRKVDGRVELLVEATIVNPGRRSVLIDGGWWPPQPLSLQFRDSSGKEVGYRGVVFRLARVPKKGFVRLQPGEIRGVRFRLVRESKGEHKGQYRLWRPDGTAFPSYYLLGRPGRYSLSLSFQGDDGSFVGVRAWHGRLESEKVWFELPG